MLPSAKTKHITYEKFLLKQPLYFTLINVSKAKQKTAVEYIQVEYKYTSSFTCNYFKFYTIQSYYGNCNFKA